MALKIHSYVIIILLSTNFFVPSQNQLKPFHNLEGRFPSQIYNRYLVVICEITSETHVEVCGGSLVTSMWVLASQNCRKTQNSKENVEENHFVVANVDDIGDLGISPRRKVLVWITHNDYGKFKNFEAK